MNKEDKLKNLKDLEYSRILNLENIILAFIGGAIISIILLKPEDLPTGLQNLKKSQMLMFLVLSIFFIVGVINYKLKQISDEIKEL